MVLGPLMFFLYDLLLGIDSAVKLFADDSRKIEGPDDNYKLQTDLSKLEEWGRVAQMKFEPTKCFKLTVTLKRNVDQCAYSLCGTVLSHVSYHHK